MNIKRTARRRIHLIKRAELLKSIAEGCLCNGIDAPEPSSLPQRCRSTGKGVRRERSAQEALVSHPRE